MGERRWEVGICGTFDVANYGDLLFPLIAEAELAERLGAVTLHRFAYHARTPPEWPFAVNSVTALPQMIHSLDGLLIGGGFLVRFDKEVAPGYAPPAPEIHHPTGYWLTPALMALQHDVPLMWNAPGTDGKSIPPWANPLLQPALTLSRYVSVRDEVSRSTLQSLTSAHVAIVPDTAFGIPQLLNLEGTPSAEFTCLCEAFGLDAPYIVVQATTGLEGFVRFLKRYPERFRKFRFLALPIGPVLGDRQELIDADVPGVVRLADWPSPLVLAELIGRSEAVVGRSYHLSITALAFGVPVFARHDLCTGKFSELQQSEAFFHLPPNGEPDPDWFLAHLGRSEPSAMARATCQPLGEHWDRIAAVLRARAAATAPALNRLWQSLPGLLEDAATQVGRLDEVAGQLAVARAETAARDARIAEILASLSWRLTAPLRFLGRHARLHRSRPLINLASIRHHRLESDPYRWAAINNLFQPNDIARLAATYPFDHFKLVARYSGGREYEFEARSLIGMGADVITYPDTLSDDWRALAIDLLSPEYRAAISTLTGCDLTKSPVEANVFHYGPGGSQGPHQDLPEKLVTHVLYFNQAWNAANGGCFRVLRSSNPADIAAEIPPIAGYSSIIVRSDNSWHAVSRVADDSPCSRRAVTVTFYRPGSVSTMWPPGDTTPTHRYQPSKACARSS